MIREPVAVSEAEVQAFLQEARDRGMTVAELADEELVHARQLLEPAPALPSLDGGDHSG